MKRFTVFSLTLLLMLMAGPLWSEIILLKNGDVLRGKIVNQTRTSVTIRKDNGSTQVIPKSDVKRIQYFSPEEEKRKEEEARLKKEQDRKKAEEARILREQEEKRLEEERLKKEKEERERLEREADEKEKAQKLEEKEQRNKEKEVLKAERRKKRDEILSGRNALTVSLSQMGGRYQTYAPRMEKGLNRISSAFSSGLDIPLKETTDAMHGSMVEMKYDFRDFYMGLSLMKATTRYELMIAEFQKEIRDEAGVINLYETSTLAYEDMNPAEITNRSLYFGWTPFIRKNMEASVYGGIRRETTDYQFRSLAVSERIQNGIFHGINLRLYPDQHMESSPKGPLLGFTYEYTTPWRLVMAVKAEWFEIKGDFIYDRNLFIVPLEGYSDHRFSGMHITSRLELKGGIADVLLKYPLGYGFSGFLSLTYMNYVGVAKNITTEFLEATLERGIAADSNFGPDQLLMVKAILNGPQSGTFAPRQTMSALRLGVEKRFDFSSNK